MRLDTIKLTSLYGRLAHVKTNFETYSLSHRYMAPETLNSIELLPPADIFSLGITLYETCTLISLPQDGALWHDLREGRAPKLNRTNALARLVSAMMHPQPDKRPTASEILNLREVQQASFADDAVITERVSHLIEQYRRNLSNPRIFRSASYDAHIGEGNTSSALCTGSNQTTLSAEGRRLPALNLELLPDEMTNLFFPPASTPH